MELLYNGFERQAPIVTFTDVYNLLQVKQNVSGTNALLELCVKGTWTSTASEITEGQYYFSIFGETITSTVYPSQAKNKKFYISSTLTDTVVSICRALRNCGSLAAQYTITVGTTTIDNDTIIIRSKTIGYKGFNGKIATNIPQNYLQQTVVSNGSADEGTNKFYGSQITTDVLRNSGTAISDYVTTLEKNFYGNECSMDVSPVLATMVEPTKDNQRIEPYTLNVNKLATDGSYDNLGSVNAYVTYGYLANQSQKYLPLEEITVLSNSKTTDRGGLLYLYDKYVDFSVLISDTATGFPLTVAYLDNAMNRIDTVVRLIPITVPQVTIRDFHLDLNSNLLAQSTYIEVYVNSQTPQLRYQVIKPLKATENNQRVWWRNEYGGLSFFDFCGKHEESDDIAIETYEKNIFDFYTNPEFERKKIYKNDIEKSVTLTSHLMKKEGIYIFNSLIRSKKVWTIVNNKVHYIIPKNVDLEEQTYDNIFVAKLTYNYSELS